MIAPTVHLNGTSKDSLLREYEAAIRHVQEAAGAIVALTVHGRDYYVQPNNPIQEALEDKARMLATLNRMEQELTEVYYKVEDQDGR